MKWVVADRRDDLIAFFADRLKVHLRETGARHDLIDAVFAAGVPHAPTSPLAGEDVAKRQEGGRAESTDTGEQPPSALPGISPARGEIGEPRRPASAGKVGAQLAPANDDLLMIVRRVAALGNFLDSDDGANLLAGYRRAVNILRIEEAKDGEGAFAGAPDHRLIEARGEPAERELLHVLESVESHLADHLVAEDFEAAMRALSELRPAVDAFFDQVMVNTDDAAIRANRLKLLNRLRGAMHRVADFSRIAG